MVKINNFTLDEIQKNLLNFNKKIRQKNLNNNFWIITDRSDFKPLKKIIKKKNEEIITNIHSIKEIRDNLLNIKGEYYKDKKFAEIKINLNEEILSYLNIIKEYNNIKNKNILTIHITIFLIGIDGSINFENKWELIVNYKIDDFRTLNFKLKNVEVLMRLASDSIITTNNLNGISYKKLLIKIQKNNENL